MQDSFTSPDGFVGVSFPDQIVPRPRLPLLPAMEAFIALLPTTDIQMAWLPTFPSQLSRIPFRATQTGAYAAAVLLPSIAPLSWMPLVLDYLAAPRVHRVFYDYKADPLSGDMMAVAQRMAWDPHPKTPLITRPRRIAGQPVLVIPTAVIAAGELCVELIDDDFTVPTLTPEDLTYATLLDEGLTVPDLITEDLC